MIKENLKVFGSVESFLTNEIAKKAASVASRTIIIVDKFIQTNGAHIQIAVCYTNININIEMPMVSKYRKVASEKRSNL